ncbi:MAG: branched-chain amino acid ABC transporter permease [Deltaproteobacteria bacterium]|nr:MAG: branched-chain amino acid ABC transporter permease [Deltaproteobacteria bacterium]
MKNKIFIPTVAVAVALVAGVVFPKIVTSPTVLSLMVQAIAYAIGTLGVSFLIRQNGQVSFGHALYYGLSTYLIALISKYVGISLGVSIVAVIALSGIFAFLIGLIIVRTPGIAFAMVTLAIGQVFYLLVSQARSLTGGADGLIVDIPSTIYGLKSSVYAKPSSMFVVSWFVLVLVVYGVYLLLNTRFGPLTEAIKENEERTRFIGYKTVVPRAVVYAVSAMLCTVAGSLSTLYTAFVSPESLHWSLSGSFLIAAILGGSSMITGSVIGAIVYFVLRDVLIYETSHWLSILGISLILVIVYWPDGISGGLRVGAAKLKMAFGRK